MARTPICQAQRRLLAALWLLVCSTALWASDRTTPPAAAIASAHPAATRAGAEILAAGGNAFDAAVAVSAALAVVEPYAAGLGGGGFWLLHRAADGREVMLDGRERAPLAAHRDLFLDEAGRFVPELALNGPLAAGRPGIAAALVHLAEHYGRLPLAASLAPAIRLARDGVAVDAPYRRLATLRLQALRVSPAAAAVFLDGGEVPAEGRIIRQPALAATLQRLAEGGHGGFYGGAVATALVNGVRAAGGLWTTADLAAYRVVERAPVVLWHRGARVVSAAPPSSGGIALAEMLNMLANFDLAGLAPADRAHLLVEVMRRAYRDRARFLGDPDQVEIPVARLTHPFYAAGLARDIDPRRVTPSLPPGCDRAEGPDTTHFSLLDQEGNRVAATLSINYPFGSGFMPAGTGVLLNDEMDDFSAQPDMPNAYGLVGGEANAIAPGKRMLSSMSPTFVETADALTILGTPGGSRIISTVLLGILASLDGVALTDLVAAPRLHHQYLPDELLVEPGALDPATRSELTARGHRLVEAPAPWGNLQAVRWQWSTGRVEAASDPRGIGTAMVIPPGQPAR